MPGEWMQQRCDGPPIRLLDDGRVEISGEGTPEKAVPAKVVGWKNLIYEKCAKYDVPPHLVAAIMTLESGGEPRASTFCCLGLMQINRSTGKSLNGGVALSDEELYDPETSVDLGVRLLRSLWNRYHGNIVNIAFGYNAGGAYCGSGCVKAKEKPNPCIASCSPNRWNLRADCYASKTDEPGKTIDYGGIVIAYMNGALKDFSPRAPDLPPVEIASGAATPQGSMLGPGLFAVLGLAAVGGTAYYLQKRGAVRWTF